MRSSTGCLIEWKREKRGERKWRDEIRQEMYKKGKQKKKEVAPGNKKQSLHEDIHVHSVSETGDRHITSVQSCLKPLARINAFFAQTSILNSGHRSSLCVRTLCKPILSLFLKPYQSAGNGSQRLTKNKHYRSAAFILSYVFVSVLCPFCILFSLWFAFLFSFNSSISLHFQ